MVFAPVSLKMGLPQEEEVYLSMCSVNDFCLLLKTENHPIHLTHLNQNFNYFWSQSILKHYKSIEEFSHGTMNDHC